MKKTLCISAALMIPGFACGLLADFLLTTTARVGAGLQQF